MHTTTNGHFRWIDDGYVNVCTYSEKGKTKTSKERGERGWEWEWMREKEKVTRLTGLDKTSLISIESLGLWWLILKRLSLFIRLNQIWLNQFKN